MAEHELAKYIALWAALPTALAALIAAFFQWLVGKRQAAAAARSAEAADKSAAAAHELARLKKSELDRDAVKFLSVQRRDDIAAMREAMIDFHTLATRGSALSDEDGTKLRRLLAELQFRVLPNDHAGATLIAAATNMYEYARTGNVEGIEKGQGRFVEAAQHKLHDDLRLIEAQVEKGKISDK